MMNESTGAIIAAMADYNGSRLPTPPGSVSNSSPRVATIHRMIQRLQDEGHAVEYKVGFTALVVDGRAFPII